MITFLIGTSGGGIGVPAWVFMLIVGAVDASFSYFVWTVAKDKPSVKPGQDVRSFNLRLGVILAYAAVAHAIGLAYTLLEGGPPEVWVLMLVALGGWLVYAWKHHRYTLLKYNVSW
jgi:hypothetical protein